MLALIPLELQPLFSPPTDALPEALRPCYLLSLELPEFHTQLLEHHPSACHFM